MHTIVIYHVTCYDNKIDVQEHYHYTNCQLVLTQIMIKHGIDRQYHVKPHLAADILTLEIHK